jgi:N-terminal half of MaoC dehydratase
VTDQRTLITPEMRAVIGAPIGVRTFTIEPLVARRLAEALGEDADAVATAEFAPQFYFSAFETPMTPANLPGGPQSGVLAGDEWEQHRPLRWGERVTSTGTVADIYERFGQHGQTLYVRYEWTFADEASAVVGVSRRILVRYIAPASGAGADEEAP